MKTMTIPHPDNPAHVENLASVDLMEAQGFAGPDRSLVDSLVEHGLVWRTVGDEILFVHRHPSLEGRFDRTSYNADTDVFREWDWAMDPTFFAYAGLDANEWLELPLQHKVWDLVTYYGPLEIFGESYWEGFAIAGLD